MIHAWLYRIFSIQAFLFVYIFCIETKIYLTKKQNLA